jgi:hypothetical protein
MKKLFLTLAIIAFLNTTAQTKTPFIIEHCIDKMTEKEYYFPQKKLICANSEKTKGFTISPNFKPKNETFSFNGFICKNVNIGNCDENDSLIFLFEDDTKITLTSWNKFNCEGNVYIEFSQDDLSQLSTKRINAIRFTNGYSHESLTYSLKEDEKGFFINVYTNNKVVEVDCSK